VTVKAAAAITLPSRKGGLSICPAVPQELDQRRAQMMARPWGLAAKKR
jgi:hypothetical protein